ncbi:hypothetical protein KP791_000079 [Venturia canescens]|uniref:Uncharacterized protein n=1 Tax=Venturia canescens TaxID=32260 RepID=A0ACB9ZIZ8_9HYME|nr:hypothetical protein KP791_000079 [Venturia canescens]
MTSHYCLWKDLRSSNNKHVMTECADVNYSHSDFESQCSITLRRFNSQLIGRRSSVFVCSYAQRSFSNMF